LSWPSARDTCGAKAIKDTAARGTDARRRSLATFKIGLLEL
jgi:hypothetical protein